VKPEEVEQKAVKMKSYAAHTHLIIMMLLPRARVPESDPQLMTNHPLSSRGFMARSRPSYDATRNISAMHTVATWWPYGLGGRAPAPRRFHRLRLMGILKLSRA
jgi:hypothetical protein